MMADKLPKAREHTKLRELRVHELSIVDAGANQGARMVLMKRDAGAAGPTTGDLIMADKTAPTLEDLEKAVQAATDDNAKVTAEKAKLEAETADLRKQLADATAAAAAKAAAESTDLTKRLEAETTARASLEKRLAQIEDERELGQYIAKAADYKHLPMPAVELAPALRAISKLDPEYAALITKALSATSEALGKALDALPFVRPDVPASAGEAEFQGLVNKRMAEKGEDEARATDEVAKTAAGKAAYRRMVAEQRAN
jgi:lipopolysaccharide biosynthesis regulator YciM